MPESFLLDQNVPVRWRLLGIINGFHINGKDFYASNDWIQRQLECSQQTVSNAVKELEELGEILVERNNNANRVIRRKLKEEPEEGTNQFVGGYKLNHVKGTNQLVPNAISNAEKYNFGESSIRVESYSSKDEDVEPRTKPDRRVKEKQAVFILFSSKEEPWMRHKQQREAALRLFDRGLDKLERGLTVMRENEDDKFCPQAHTPFQYEEKLPNLNAYIKRQGL